MAKEKKLPPVKVSADFHDKAKKFAKDKELKFGGLIKLAVAKFIGYKL